MDCDSCIWLRLRTRPSGNRWQTFSTFKWQALGWAAQDFGFVLFGESKILLNKLPGWPEHKVVRPDPVLDVYDFYETFVGHEPLVLLSMHVKLKLTTALLWFSSYDFLPFFFLRFSYFLKHNIAGIKPMPSRWDLACLREKTFVYSIIAYPSNTILPDYRYKISSDFALCICNYSWLMKSSRVCVLDKFCRIKWTQLNELRSSHTG
jgi:hypothetical protein